MTDRELEERVRTWYAAHVGENETAPEDLRGSLAAIPVKTPTPLRPASRRQGLTLLAAAAVMVVGGALAAGSGLLRMTSIVPPEPSTALLATSGPTPSETPSPTANLRPGSLIAFVRSVEKPRVPCDSIHESSPCPIPRVWIAGSDGRGARELFPDGVAYQADPTWSPDGTRLLYWDDGKLSMTDPSGGPPQPVDTGCVAPCVQDSQIAFSSDGRSIVFARESMDAEYLSLVTIATLDLESGRVAQLISTAPAGGAQPGWSPDGRQIVFWRFGDKDTGGPLPPVSDAVFVIDADGQNLRQVTPATLDARDAEWSPDGARILFVSPNGEQQDIYTIRPDGTDMRPLTTDGFSTSATWMADGRILFVRGAGSGAAAGWWTMDADGTNATALVTATALGVAAADLEGTRPTRQPLGGAAIVPLPWTPAPGIAVGPPAPTPAPTPTPDLAPGFSWTGSSSATENGPLGETATLLDDGRVLMTGGCSTAAELYDPATGAFSPTGAQTAPRGSGTATRLGDGRVLLTGGYNCGKAGEDGIWASAELYDPATGTFIPTGSMGTPREFHTATLLADGRVLIAGGFSGPSPTTAATVTLASTQTAESAASVLKTAEVYDPATGRFSKTGSMSTFRDNHTATLLEDGRVLVAGGGGEGYASSTSADVYDPVTGRFSKTGSMKTGRWLHTATLLQDGRVLVLGGRSPQDSVYTSAETYDPGSGKFRSAGSMGEGRQQHTATLLPDGRILIAGGYWSDGQKWRVLSSTEMYDSATGNYSPIGSMGTPREGHSATLLNDGRVLIAGGADIGSKGAVGVASAVLFQP